MDITLVSPASGSVALAFIPFLLVFAGLVTVVCFLFFGYYEGSKSLLLTMAVGSLLIVVGLAMSALGAFAASPALYKISGTVSTIERQGSYLNYNMFFGGKDNADIVLHAEKAIEPSEYEDTFVALGGCIEVNGGAYLCTSVEHAK